jgi:hypothetical protein
VVYQDRLGTNARKVLTIKSLLLFHTYGTYIAEVAAAEVKQRRISLQILSNGSEWIELERNVPSGYCQYNLQALTTCADLSMHMSLLLPDSDATTSMTSTGSGGSGSSGGGSSVWDFSTEDGRSLRKAIDWLLPYAANQTRWP